MHWVQLWSRCFARLYVLLGLLLILNWISPVPALHLPRLQFEIIDWARIRCLLKCLYITFSMHKWNFKRNLRRCSPNTQMNGHVKNYILALFLSTAASLHLFEHFGFNTVYRSIVIKIVSIQIVKRHSKSLCGQKMVGGVFKNVLLNDKQHAPRSHCKVLFRSGRQEMAD